MNEIALLFIVLSVIQTIVFVFVLYRVHKSVTRNMQAKLDAILQFSGDTSFFVTLNQALKQVDEEISSNYKDQDKLLEQIATAQDALAEFKLSLDTLSDTKKTIAELSK